VGKHRIRRRQDSGGIMGSVNMSSIMRFEDLLELWQGHHAQQPVLEFLGIRSQGDVRGVEESDPGFMRVLRERLDGSWWEVTWSRPPARRGLAGGVRCRYLADTLKDAVRRCPGAQLSLKASIDDDGDVLADDELEIRQEDDASAIPW
jgi:hypothetical protein